MTEAEARAYLESMVAWTDEPVLSTTEVDRLLAYAGSELAGYRLELAAAEGWRWKAGKVAALYSFQIDNDMSDQGQVYRNCLDQAIWYSDAAASGQGIGGAGPSGMNVMRIKGLISGNGSAAEEPSLP